jgi:tetratricopeptide (TPR) repeat protein
MEPGDEERLMQIENRLRRAIQDRSEPLEQVLEQIRSPSWMALRHARALRDEGQSREARERCTRMLAALEERQLPQRYPAVLELAAEIQMVLGSAWTAEGEGRKAEVELLAAVERLEALEALLVERGAREWARAVRISRAGALTSLAVNANVKLLEPERALEFFERAHALHQDDFSRLLLACYRARSGQSAEARALLADVPVAPPFYYNLACTHALLGEHQRALELLERDLRENHASEGSLRRQREWAREDPDLASLRDDPRFRFLVGEEDLGPSTALPPEGESR